jgi:putative transposase
LWPGAPANATGQENTVMDKRIGFIKDYNLGLLAKSELCERYQISRKTGYQWLQRYPDFGPAGLMDRPRRPHLRPTTVLL